MFSRDRWHGLALVLSLAAFGFNNARGGSTSVIGSPVGALLNPSIFLSITSRLSLLKHSGLIPAACMATLIGDCNVSNHAAWHSSSCSMNIVGPLFCDASQITSSSSGNLAFSVAACIAPRAAVTYPSCVFGYSTNDLQISSSQR